MECSVSRREVEFGEIGLLTSIIVGRSSITRRDCGFASGVVMLTSECWFGKRRTDADDELRNAKVTKRREGLEK